MDTSAPAQQRRLQETSKRGFSSGSGGMDAFMEFEREMAMKRRQQQPKATRLQQAAPLQPPVKPRDDECCNQGCPNCVFLVYQEKLLEYELSLLAQTQKPQQRLAVPEPKYVVTYLDNDSPSSAQQQRLRENNLAVFDITTNEMISAPHRTKDNWWRSVRHIELHVRDEQKEYVGENASNIAVFVPNDVSVVDRMIVHLQVDPDLIFTAEAIVLEADSSALNAVPKHFTLDRPFESIGSVREALTWSFDLISTPRASFLRKLAAFATSEDEVQALLAPHALDDLATERPGQPVTVADIFDHFPSLRLNFAAFFQIAPLNAPRYYTVSSSRRFFPNIVSITLGLKELDTQPVPRCSSYLSALSPGKHTIRASFFHSTFVFPQQDRHPLLLVSAGTGIAPFRAFLQDLEHERYEEQQQQLEPFVATTSAADQPRTRHRNAYLFYGCRSPEVDFLYADELHEAHAQRVLDQLHVVFSNVEGQPRRYVQDALREQSALVVDHLMRQRGYLFVCGSLAMGRAVKHAIVDALVAHADVSGAATEDAAKALVTQWLENGQLVTELW